MQALCSWALFMWLLLCLSAICVVQPHVWAQRNFSPFSALAFFSTSLWANDLSHFLRLLSFFRSSFSSALSGAAHSEGGEGEEEEGMEAAKKATV